MACEGNTRLLAAALAADVGDQLIMMKTVRLALINVAVLAFCLLLAEGASSLYYAFDDMRSEEIKKPKLAEWLHTEHDPLLG